MIVIKTLRFEKTHTRAIGKRVLAVVLAMILTLSMVLVAVPITSALNTNGVNFGNQETIYLDLSDFTDWYNDGAQFRVFTYYGDNTNWNVENGADDSGIHNTSGWSKALVPETIANNIYKFRIGNEYTGAVKIMRLNGSITQEWNSSGFMYSTNKGTNNCIKITGWDNSASWSTYTVTPKTNGGSHLTANPGSTITGNPNLYTIDARFYDYYTDEEILNGWRNNTYSSTHGDWEPYEALNKAIADDASSNSVRYPLYFGNFYDKDDGYKRNNGHYSLYNFSNWVNNSSRLNPSSPTGFTNSVIKLAGATLNGTVGSDIINRKITYRDGYRMPIFDTSWLTSNGLATVIDADFPTRMEDRNGVKYYVFDSNGATDNIWFTGYGSSTLTLNYGQGPSNGTYDALDYYSDPKENKGYGFFPFDHGGDGKDFGFGMRLDVTFNVAENGKLVDNNGEEVAQKFEFTGDDDVWVYIDGVLVLDLGGDHKKAHGVIDFSTLKSTVYTGINDPYEGNMTPGEISFDFPTNGFPTADGKFDNTDITADHRLTMFYVERGMIESNLKFEFNFAPLGSNYIVTEKIETKDVNPGLVSDVTGLDTFKFYPTEKDTNGKTVTWPNGLTYKSGNTEYKDTNQDYFTLGSGGSARLGNFFTVGNDIAVRQEHGDSVLKYTTSWVYKDNVNTDNAPFETVDGRSGISNTTQFATLIDSSTEDIYDFAELQVDFVNTPVVADVKITKDTVDYAGDSVATDQEFDATVAIDFGGKNGPYYNFKYTASDSPNVTQEAQNGVVKLKAGRTITIKGVPVNAKITVTETNPGDFTPSYTSNGATLTEGGLTVGVKNTLQAPGPGSATLAIRKNFENADIAELAGVTLANAGFTFELKETTSGATYSERVVATSDTVNFSKIEFDTAGTRTFTIKEVAPSLAIPNVTYDYNTTYTVEVTATKNSATNNIEVTSIVYKNASGQTVYSVNGDSVNTSAVPAITNTYNSGSVSITKLVQKDDGTSYNPGKNFTATVKIKYPNTSDFATYDLYYTEAPVSGGAQSSPIQMQNGKITLKKDYTITIAGLPIGTQVSVEEDADNDYTVTYNPRNAILTVGTTGELTITNKLKPQEPDTKAFSATKTLSTNATYAGVTLANSTFKFELRDASGVLQTKTADSNGNVQFEPIAYTQAGTYEYTITEIDAHKSNDTAFANNDSNIIYSTKEYKVVVVVETRQDANGNDYLFVNDPVYSPDGAAVFENDYKLGKATVTKEVKGVDDKNAYTFDIEVSFTYPDGYKGTKLASPQTVTFSEANGWSKTFDKLPIGTKVSVVENDSKGFEVSYDPKEAVVGENTDAAVKVVNTLVKPGSASIGVTKAFTDIANKAGLDKTANNTYKFTLKNADGSYTDTKFVNGAGSVNFKEISFPDEGTYTYTITELDTTANDVDINKNDKNIIYDKSEYTVKFTVSRVDDKLEVSAPDITKGDAAATSVVFTNDYKTGNAEFKKVALDIDGSEFTPDVEFEFTVEVSYDGSASGYTKYADVKLKAGETYTVPEDLPVGAKVRVTETNTQGFNNDNLTQEIAVEADKTVTITVTNQRPEAGATSITLSATKTLTGATLSAGDFSFTISGEGAASNKVYTNAQNGSVTFDTINYKYSKNNDEKSSGNTVVLHDNDFTDGEAQRTYTIKESKGSNTDVIYDETEYTAVVTITKTETPSNVSLSSAVSYYKDGDKADAAAFANSIRTGMVTINKSNQAGENVKDVTFALYKVSGDNLTREDVMNLTPAEKKATNADGVVEFTGIELYTSDSVKLSDADKYQWYCVAELNPAEGYTINGELHFFQLPTGDSYELTYSYVNGRIVSPTTGGEGMFAFKLAGITLMGLALLLFACYLIYVRKPARKRVDK